MTAFSFHKKQRISSKRDIEFLFRDGKATFLFPFRVTYALVEFSDYPVKILISVPRNKIRRAVQRNRIKRLTREAWRLNNENLQNPAGNTGKTLLVALIYIHDMPVDYEQVEKAIIKIMKQLENV